WTYSCDWSWGWLPFHYGRWGWFHGYWGWQPGYRWGAAWVDWRHGGGYVGWRPMGPNLRGNVYPTHDSHWNFTTNGDFTRPHIRSHLFGNRAEGLRATQPVTHPPIRPNPGTQPVRPSTVMHGRPHIPTTNVRTQAWH